MRVLVVDDDDILVRATAAALRQSGVDVATASSGEDALQVLDQKPVDAVLIDLMMPRMNGIELIRTLQQRSPGLRIVLTSSFPLSPGQIDRMGLDDVGFLPKPATPEELLAAVRGVPVSTRPLESVREHPPHRH